MSRQSDRTLAGIVQALMLMLLLSCSHLLARADDWPSTFHDPANTGISSEVIRLPQILQLIPGSPRLSVPDGKDPMYSCTGDTFWFSATDLVAGNVCKGPEKAYVIAASSSEGVLLSWRLLVRHYLSKQPPFC